MTVTMAETTPAAKPVDAAPAQPHAPPPELFPHERVVFFSDAVFAIAMTLLAIELKPPSHALVASVGEARAWDSMTSMFIAYVISFLVTAIYWVNHLQVWKQVRHATARLVWLNVLMLMFVALVPFGTNLYAESFVGGSAVSFAVYALILTGIAFFSLWLRIAVTRQERLRERMGAAEARWFVARAVVPFAVFAAAIPLAFVIPSQLGSALFIAIGPLSALVKRWAMRERVQP